ncbi:uncharacterized protein LOC110617008 isoform X2 [Manihot esculenta]|nr:uncharacterized protein LOC110617008 isoform X2 [Manihot esculenta]XP_021615278.1 uncharacterized protein LOC110617008 isoform X2 [Manihot esculenta]XP_043813301.1 uncharacterized protein LOC110617008 isoform X2 [Manihot esculenta]KAG8652010.1 hypothetical protein MANES_06G045200v8 [Manihot esculenta]
MPCSSGAELLSREKSSHLLDSIELRPLSTGMEATDSTMKLLNVNSSLAHQHYNVGRPIFLKRSRHHYGHQYSRRNSGNNAHASSSHGKIAPLRDERLAFRLSGSEFGHHTATREKAFGRADRIRLSSLVMDASDAVKIICGICQKPLRRKPYFLGEALSSGECSIVAVLVCGHVYHADCLEQRTSDENRCDPPCPSCLGLLSQEDPSRG